MFKIVATGGPKAPQTRQIRETFERRSIWAPAKYLMSKVSHEVHLGWIFTPFVPRNVAEGTPKAPRTRLIREAFLFGLKRGISRS